MGDALYKRGTPFTGSPSLDEVVADGRREACKNVRLPSREGRRFIQFHHLLSLKNQLPLTSFPVIIIPWICLRLSPGGLL